METSSLRLTQEEIESLKRLPDSELKSILKEMAEKKAGPSQKNVSYQERQRAADLARKNAANAALRDVGEIPDIKNPQERENAKWDLRYDIERYHPEKVNLGFCDDHITLINACQKAIIETTQQAVAMTRGSGKSTIMRLAVEWAIRHGHRRWPMLINAEMDLFKKQIRAFKTTFKNKKMLAEDFPETIWVYQQAKSSQGAPNMTCLGEPMEMVITTEEIVMPTNYMSRELGTDGRVISGGGITGSVRGAQYTLPGGEIIRPDCVLIDDFQTRESSASPKQIRDRVQTIASDVMGCAGPGVPMSALLACTVITNNDAAHQILGPEHPEWKAIIGKWIIDWPINERLWNEYGSLLRKLKSSDGDLEEANEFYRRHRYPHGPFCKTPGMDCGAKVYWEARIGNHIMPKAISSLQTAMSWHILNPEAFAAEAQNSPIDPHEPEDVIYCPREEILAKVAPYQRFEVPNDANELVAYIDVQQEVFVYAVMAVCPGFRRYVVDYGTWPDQKRDYWNRSQLSAKLSQIWASPKQAWLQGLIRTADHLSENAYTKSNGQAFPVTFGLIDSSDGDVTDIVFQFCREYGNGMWLPNQGAPTGPNEINFRSEQKSWQKRHVDWGPYWNRSSDRDRGCDRIRHESDWWKSYVHVGIRTPENDEGSLQFFDGEHLLLADHLRSEYPDNDRKGGREYTHWTLRPQRPDNDLFDCVSGCGVAASVRRIPIPGMGGQRRDGGRRRRKFGRSSIK